MLINRKFVTKYFIVALFTGLLLTTGCKDPKIEAENKISKSEKVANYGLPEIIISPKQTNTLETRLENDKYIVITPAGEEIYGQRILSMLPECEVTLENFMGYLRPWEKGAYKFYVQKTEKKIEITPPHNAYTASGTTYIVDNVLNFTREGKDCMGELIAHESIHQFMPPEKTNIPRWFSEGSAEFFAKIYTNPETEYRCEDDKYIQCSIANPNKCVYSTISSLDLATGENEIYKSGMCFFNMLYKEGGPKKFQHLMKKVIIEQDPQFNSALNNKERNKLFVERYITPIYGAQVAPLLKKFGIGQE